MKAYHLTRFCRSLTLPLGPFRIGTFVGVLMCCALQAEAADRFVRQGASGTGSGSDWTNAYTTLPATLQRGNTYYIADGSYAGYTFDDAAAGATYTTIKKATVADHGSGTGWSNSYGDGQATFTGQISFTTSYWVFNGQVGGGPGSWKTGHGFKVSQTSCAPVIHTTNGANIHHFTIAHAELQGDLDNSCGGSKGQDAFAFSDNDNLTISHVYSDNIGRTHLWTWGGSNDITVEYSYFGRHVSSSAVHSEIASISGSNRLTFRYNVFAHAEGTGGLIMGADDVKIYGNVFYRPSGDTWQYGNGVIGTWTRSTLTNLKVHNNSFVNLTDSAFNSPVFGILFTPPITGNEARNNLFYNVANVGSGGIIPASSRSHNHYVDTTFGSETNKTTSTGNPFINYVNLNFTLTAATMAGQSLGSPYTMDALNATRGADGTWDRGAFEFGGQNPPSSLNPPNNLRTTQP